MSKETKEISDSIENFVDSLRELLKQHGFHLEDSARFYIPEIKRTIRIDSSSNNLIELDR